MTAVGGDRDRVQPGGPAAQAGPAGTAGAVGSNDAVDVVVDGAVVRVAVHGDLDVSTSGPIVDTVVASIAGARLTRVVVDMTDAGFVDSTGLGSLVRLRMEARRYGARTALVGLDPRLQKLLRLTGLDEHFATS